MNIKLNEIKLNEAEYIETKKLAYTYYEQYKKLNRDERKKFLDMIPELDSLTKTLIVKNTLLFPDTEQLLTTPKGNLFTMLKSLAMKDDNITEDDIVIKQFEYLANNTAKLVIDGKLSVMDEIYYQETNISEKEYLSLKEEALAGTQYFRMFSLQKKARFIDFCLDDTSYEMKLQLATVLIPNDKLFIEELTKGSSEELSKKYKLPLEIIEFKQKEYEIQNTRSLIEQNKLTTDFENDLWYGIGNTSDFKSFFVDLRTEAPYIRKAYDSLSNMYKSESLTK